MNHTASRPHGALRARKVPLHVDDVPTAAPERADGACEWRQAVVLCVEGTKVTLRMDGLLRAARVAFGCLVVVREGDIVAALVQGDCCWIMGVLERPGCQDVSLRANGELELNASRIRVHAQEVLTLQAQQAALSCDQAQLVSKGARIVSGSVKVIGALLDTVFDTVRHYSKQHQRTTDGVDRTRAQHLELQAEQMMQLHAAHTLITGERLVKARGAQIHLG